MAETFADRLHQTRLKLGRRIVGHIRDGASDLAEAPMRNDVSVYTDPARQALERRKLFRETPVVACLSSVIYGRRELSLQNVHHAIAEAIGLPLPGIASPPPKPREAAE